MARSRQRDADTPDLFPELLSPEAVQKKMQRKLLRPLKHAIWSHHKARLIELYLKYFVMITHHGTYIDGFAGPQQPGKPESWSAKRVIESRPRLLRHFYLCELDTNKVAMLNELWNAQPPREAKESRRDCRVMPGDFNVSIDEILKDPRINEREATFALLDQRTFECHWDTVRKLAAHKQEQHKIELFYFLAVGWMSRSIAGTRRNFEKVQRWWGPGEWRGFGSLRMADMARVFSARLQNELGYKHANPFPIRGRKDGGRIMYYMIHATDHDEAPGLMWRAYHQALQLEKPPHQGKLVLAVEDG